MILRYHPSASIEVTKAYSRYRNLSPDLGEAFLFELSIKETLAKIEPQQWQTRSNGTRRLNFDRFPYHMAFLSSDALIWIVAVAHSRRRPDYWRGRLERVMDSARII